LAQQKEIKMKKIFFVIVILSIVSIPVLSQAGGTASSDYTIALMKKSNGEKIKAFEGYIVKYPSVANKYTKFAHYWLAVYYYKAKKFSKAVSYGLKSEKMGGLDNGMKAQLLFLLSRSYALKGPLFNKNKAIAYANKTINVAKANNIKKILVEAKKIKKKLSTPPKPSETPVQKVGRLHNDKDFAGVVSAFNTLKDADKTNEKLHKIYANALLKTGKYKKAIVEFTKIYAADKKAKYAKKLADCNAKLSKKAKTIYLNKAARYYAEAGLLYGKEGNNKNKKNALASAKLMVYQKYNLNKKIKAYNDKIKNSKSSNSKNKLAIKKATRELSRFKRYLRREYRNMTPPAYETKKQEKLEKKLSTLKAGGGTKTNSGGAKLKALRTKADAEFDSLVKQAKARV
jgi:hypothetical protein